MLTCLLSQAATFVAGARAFCNSNETTACENTSYSDGAVCCGANCPAGAPLGTVDECASPYEPVTSDFCPECTEMCGADEPTDAPTEEPTYDPDVCMKCAQDFEANGGCQAMKDNDEAAIDAAIPSAECDEHCGEAAMKHCSDKEEYCGKCDTECAASDAETSETLCDEGDECRVRI